MNINIRRGILSLGAVTTIWLLVAGSIAWACTTLEGTITLSNTSPSPGATITLSYSGGTNPAPGYQYHILFGPTTFGDAYCSPEGRLADGPASANPVALPVVELGTANATAGSFGPVSITIPSQWPSDPVAGSGDVIHPVIGGAQICVYSDAVYTPPVAGVPGAITNPTHPDYCNGFGPVTQPIDCTQAWLTGLPRRGKVQSITVL